MFDGMPDQFYQFLAANSRATNNTSTIPAAAVAAAAAASLPISFSLLHANFSPPQPHPHPHPHPQQQQNFDASYLYHHHHPQLPLQQLHQQVTRNDAAAKENCTTIITDERSSPLMVTEPLWSNEEVLALLKIRSTMDSPWFSTEFTWENVSRKLGEAGFKRSAQKCKEKFEEETRSFNNSSSNNNSNNIIGINNNKNDIISQNYRLFGELEELCKNTTTGANHNNSDSGDGNDNDHHQEQSPPPHQQDEIRPLISRKNQSPRMCNEDEDLQEEVEKEKYGSDDNDEMGGARDGDDSMEEGGDDDGDEQSVDDSEKTEENTKKVVRKRKRQKKFEMFKGFCEKIVNQMMVQQEELHCRILQDMVKRDEEKLAREETWKKQKIDRITREMEVRAHEQAIVGDRQAKILGFLKKFSSLSKNSITVECHSFGEKLLGNVLSKVPNANSLSTSSSILSQDSISVSATTHDHNNSSSKDNNLAPQSPNRLENPKLALPISSSCLEKASKNPNPVTVTSQSDLFRVASMSTPKSLVSNHTITDATGQVTEFKSPDRHFITDSKLRVGDFKHDDTGRRWPRDEVLALINIRCSLFSNNGDQHDRESFSKGPLWERISQKMMELGYKRSAKRCKEKWENINKYFRKTKDLNKKRSVDSRTCPYFHQLAHLYNQGPLHGQSDRPAILAGSSDNQSMPSSGAQGGSASTTSNGATTTTVHASQGNEGTVVQVSAGFDFAV